MEIDGVSYDVWSLSARRAWIEIFLIYHYICKEVVALRKESVDRNSAVMRQNPGEHVALRKESVDRNMLYNTSSLMKCRRSPQGERG